MHIGGARFECRRGGVERGRRAAEHRNRLVAQGREVNRI
jgi:hypothetical protein